MESITKSDINQTLVNLPAQTKTTVLSVLKTIFRTAVERDLLDVNVASGISLSKPTVVPRPFKTVEELKLCSLGKYRTQILFLASHGLRWSEAVALTDSDIRDGRVHITKSTHGATKSKSGIRSVPLISPFESFPKTPKGVRRICHENGIHIHSLRHSYAYLLKQSGVHVTTAQKLLGHANPNVTLGIYTGFRDEEIEQAGLLIRAHCERS